MNMIKKSLKIPGMRKAVSTTNISDKPFSDCESSTHNLTLDRRSIKIKTHTSTVQDLSEMFNKIYNSISSNSNGDFSDDLPTSLDEGWLLIKYSAETNLRLQKKNSAMFELLTTELNYLNQMLFLLEISSKIVCELQHSYFQNVNTEEVFLNIGEIYEVNFQFWTQFLYPSYKSAYENNEYISCTGWKAGFNQISTLFVPYQIYCSKMTQCQKYIQLLDRDQHFCQFLQWFSRTDQSNRESLRDFIAKPFQRLTRYSLLLSTISNYSDNEDERNDLSDMILSVNSFIKQVELKLSMDHIYKRIDPIDLVDPPMDDLLELCTPFRQLHLNEPIRTNEGDVVRQIIKEGTFKMKEAPNKTSEISLILFTDLILICQKIKNFELDRIKVIRPIIPLNKLNTVSPMPGNLVLRVIDDFGCLASIYLLISEKANISDWTYIIGEAHSSIKSLFTPKQNMNCKQCPVLTVNVINPSPLPGQSPTQVRMFAASPTLNKNLGVFYQPQDGDWRNLSRSNFRSSPVTRKRLSSKCLKKSRAESMYETPSMEFGPEVINRSLSQHYTKSQLFVLQNNDDENIGMEDWSSSTINIHSLEFDAISEYNENMTCDSRNDFMNGDSKIGSNGDLMFGLESVCKVNVMRAYGSMVNLSVDP